MVVFSARVLGIAAALPSSLLHGFPNFLPLPVIFHLGRVGHAVIEHRAVRINPGDASGAGSPAVSEEINSVFFHCRRHIIGLLLHLGVVFRGEVAVQRTHGQGNAGDKHRHGHQKNVLENLTFQWLFPRACSPRPAPFRSGLQRDPVSGAGSGCARPPSGSHRQRSSPRSR